MYRRCKELKYFFAHASSNTQRRTCARTQKRTRAHMRTYTHLQDLQSYTHLPNPARRVDECSVGHRRSDHGQETLGERLDSDGERLLFGLESSEFDEKSAHGIGVSDEKPQEEKQDVHVPKRNEDDRGQTRMSDRGCKIV